jgi:dolichol-phosphate mannosyltransferase
MFPDGISVVTTTWNERESIEKLVAAIHNALHEYTHEIIVVDDSSTDGTINVARQFADVAVTKPREGQSKGLLYGMRLAKYRNVVTIDADLENDPKYVPQMLEKIQTSDVVNASRTEIPRLSEKVASGTLGRLLGVSDLFSNFRVFRRETVAMFDFRGGETFGSEFIVIAKKKGLRISEFMYVPSPRRGNPRIGGTVVANLRIFWALIKSSVLYIV